jgi:16S rRNA U516 pseudouridylate synthase RsuA-like enzyme
MNMKTTTPTLQSVTTHQMHNKYNIGLYLSEGEARAVARVKKKLGMSTKELIRRAIKSLPCKQTTPQ